MKRNTIITLAVLLAAAGLISYGIIWLRKKASGTVVSPADKPAADTTSVNNPGAGYQVPAIQSEIWWINKLGHASFPIGMNSRGIEVLKIQHTMNLMTVNDKIDAPKIAEDGIWGFETDARFKLLFPAYQLVTQYQYMTTFDRPINE